MTDDTELDYAYLTQDALRGVVRRVLELTVALGHPPGEHHFYIEFSTEAPGVQISPRLHAQYPVRMTIVLQHQFEGLEVDEEGFAVTLHFGGAPDRLVIPFSAVTQFADPSASFALQFAPPDIGEESEGNDETSATVETFRSGEKPKLVSTEDDDGPDDDGPNDDGDGDDGPNDDGDGGADVVSLDRFRKK